MKWVRDVSKSQQPLLLFIAKPCGQSHGTDAQSPHWLVDWRYTNHALPLALKHVTLAGCSAHTRFSAAMKRPTSTASVNSSATSSERFATCPSSNSHLPPCVSLVQNAPATLVFPAEGLLTLLGLLWSRRLSCSLGFSECCAAVYATVCSDPRSSLAWRWCVSTQSVWHVGHLPKLRTSFHSSPPPPFVAHVSFSQPKPFFPPAIPGQLAHDRWYNLRDVPVVLFAPSTPNTHRVNHAVAWCSRSSSTWNAALWRAFPVVATMGPGSESRSTVSSARVNTISLCTPPTDSLAHCSHSVVSKVLVLTCHGLRLWRPDMTHSERCFRMILPRNFYVGIMAQEMAFRNFQRIVQMPWFAQLLHPTKSVQPKICVLEKARDCAKFGPKKCAGELRWRTGVERFARGVQFHGSGLFQVLRNPRDRATPTSPGAANDIRPVPSCDLAKWSLVRKKSRQHGALQH